MMGRLLWNDIRSHKLLSLSTVIFMAASSLLISLAVVLFTGLLGSVDGLMTRAETPDYLQENTDTDVFAAEYGRAGLYANGPAVTKPLIRMMNALSDGLMIFVIFLVGIGVLLISLLCIHFITAIGVEQEWKKVGILKALGVGNRSIRSLYFAKYILLVFFGMAAGFLGAEILKNPLSGKLRELYGVSEYGLPSVVIAIVVCALIQGLILLYIRHILKNFEKISALEAIFSVKTQRKKAELGQYAVIGLVAAACTILALAPQTMCREPMDRPFGRLRWQSWWP